MYIAVGICSTVSISDAAIMHNWLSFLEQNTGSSESHDSETISVSF